MKKSIYLMHHGQDDDRFIGGWTQNGLTALGRLEIGTMAEQVVTILPVRRIYASDLRQAYCIWTKN